MKTKVIRKRNEIAACIQAVINVLWVERSKLKIPQDEIRINELVKKINAYKQERNRHIRAGVVCGQDVKEGA